MDLLYYNKGTILFSTHYTLSKSWVENENNEDLFNFNPHPNETPQTNWENSFSRINL